MKFLLFFLMITFSISGLSQVVYCEMYIEHRPNTKIDEIYFDFGKKEMKIEKEFESKIEALDFMSEQGWEYLDFYWTASATKHQLHYLFKKKLLINHEASKTTAEEVEAIEPSMVRIESKLDKHIDDSI